MADDVIVLAKDPAFADALVRLVELALEVDAYGTVHPLEVEEILAEQSPIVVLESDGSADDFSFLLRAWRLRPEAPCIVCSDANRLDAHLAFGPLAALPTPTAPGPLVKALRRGLLARPWLDEAANPPIGLPGVLPVDLSSVDVMHLLRRDPLTFNLWRETSNPSFTPPNHASAHFGAQASYALPRAFLPRADLSRANLNRMGLYGACLRGSVGIFTQLSGVDLRDSDLEGVTLVGADLRDSDLRGASLEGAEFVACDLRGVEVSGSGFDVATVVDCEIDAPARVSARSA